MDRQVKLEEDQIFFLNTRSPLTLRRHHPILIDFTPHLLALLAENYLIFSIIPC